MHDKFLFLIITHLKDKFQQICSFICLIYAIVETQKQNKKLLRDWAACARTDKYGTGTKYEHSFVNVIDAIL